VGIYFSFLRLFENPRPTTRPRSNDMRGPPRADEPLSFVSKLDRSPPCSRVPDRLKKERAGETNFSLARCRLEKGDDPSPHNTFCY
jgi:hypothetical protein